MKYLAKILLIFGWLSVAAMFAPLDWWLLLASLGGIRGYMPDYYGSLPRMLVGLLGLGPVLLSSVSFQRKRLVLSAALSFIAITLFSILMWLGTLLGTLGFSTGQLPR